MDDWNGNCTAEGMGFFLLRSFKYLLAGFLLAFIFSVKSFGAAAPVEVEGAVKKDTVWSGEVLVVGDVLVPEGVTLKIAPGTRVMFLSSESSKIEPVFISMQTELMVRGRLLVEGEKNSPVVFGPAPEDLNTKMPERGDWGGIILDGACSGGSLIKNAVISMAETAVSAYGSSPSFESCRLENNKYGLVSMGGAKPKLSGCVVEGGEFGVVSGKGSKPDISGTDVRSNEKNFIAKD